MADRFARAASGQANVVLLSGDAGIGKTCLLSEAAAEAVRGGAVLLRGRGTEIEGMPPYLLFVEALGSYIRAAPSAVLRRQIGRGASALAEMLPELAKNRPNLHPDAALPPEDARLRLFQSVGQFLNAIAAGRPVMLCLDDLHWADPGSLDLFDHVGCRRGLGRVLIAGAYREGESSANATLNRVIDHLNRDRLLTTLRLSALSAEEIGELAANLLSGAIDDALSRSLHDQCEGNPFFAEELLECWRESGAIVAQNGHWSLAAGSLPGRIPAGIAGTVRQRLARLSAEILASLQIAALIGRTFELEVIAAVEGLSVDFVEAKMTTASRTGLIRMDEGGSFSFTHDKVRECLYAEIPTSRRRRWHLAIGSAIEARRNGAESRDLAALAFHFSRSDDRAKAVSYALSAAKSALRGYAAGDAISHFETALQLIDADDERQAEILLGLGRALAMADDLVGSAEVHRRACALALRADDRLTAARAALGLAQAHTGLRQWREARAELQRAIALLKDQPGPELVQALSQLAGAEAILGDFAAGVAHAQKAQEYAARLGDPLLEAKACRALGKLLTRMRTSVAEGVQIIERALALAKAADDPAEMAACLFRVAYAALNAGQLARSVDATCARIALAQRANDPFQQYHARTWLAYMAALEGDWPEVARLIAELQSPVERLASPEPLIFLLKAKGYCAYQRGEFLAAEAAFAAVEDILGGGEEGLTLYRGLLGLAQLAAGKPAAALGSMARHERLLASMPADSVSAGPVLVCLASMALALRDRPRLRRYYEAMAPLSGQYYWFLVDRVLAAIETVFGDWLVAERHLAAAEVQARREGMRPELPLVLAAQAELELARGGRGSAMRARQALAGALRLFDELGMAAESARARERLRRLPRQPGAPLSASLPAGLSGREAQVLGLVAAGLSNKEIARQLALSDRTVANHLTSIFNKTGANNRAAATAFALRHGLPAG